MLPIGALLLPLLLGGGGLPGDMNCLGLVPDAHTDKEKIDHWIYEWNSSKKWVNKPIICVLAQRILAYCYGQLPGTIELCNGGLV